MVQIKRLVGAAVALALLVYFGIGTASAQQAPSTFTLQPGGTAVVSYQAFCTEFGKIFPDGIQGPSGSVAPAAAQAAMSYGISKGYDKDGQQALQLQYGIWQALGTTTAPTGDATAQDIATNGKTPPANPQGTSVLDAFKANQIKLTLNSWAPIGPKVAITSTATDNFYGGGQLTIQNTSQQALTLYMPVGTLFAPTNPAHQTMAAYATNVQVNNPQQTLPNTAGEDDSTIRFMLIALTLLGLGLAMHSMRRAVA